MTEASYILSSTWTVTHALAHDSEHEAAGRLSKKRFLNPKLGQSVHFRWDIIERSPYGMGAMAPVALAILSSEHVERVVPPSLKDMFSGSKLRRLV